MKKEKIFGLQWKLTLALVVTGLALVGIYVAIATRVFESDKISYVFDAQSSKLESVRREFEGKIQKILVTSKSILATLDPRSRQVNAVGRDLFDTDGLLQSLDLYEEHGGAIFFHLDKKNLPPLAAPTQKVGDRVLVLPGPEGRLVFLFRPYRTGVPYVARAIIDISSFFPRGGFHQTLVLARGQDILLDQDTEVLEPGQLKALLQDVAREKADVTRSWGEGDARFLVSVTHLEDLSLIALTPEREALGALKTLFYRSLVFFIFSALGLTVISLFLAKGLTANLKVLTLAAEDIGRGEFDRVPALKSRDETGLLARAFAKMAQEIQRLLRETQDKARMEAELKTAKLVQESLLPAAATFREGAFEINGLVLTSTECGGDWWYYFVRGREFYIAIADATGHGTPAALITAAARSVFSRLEAEDLSLLQMMRAWDTAVSSCSNRQVFMTGVLMRINLDTGESRYLSAGHEPPYLFTPEPDGLAVSSVSLDLNPVLGEGWKERPAEEQSLQLPPGASLLLYTDGLFSVEHADGKKLSERRYGKNLAGQMTSLRSAEEITDLALRIFEDHRHGEPLPDDVTLVTIHRHDS